MRENNEMIVYFSAWLSYSIYANANKSSVIIRENIYRALLKFHDIVAFIFKKFLSVVYIRTKKKKKKWI